MAMSPFHDSDEDYERENAREYAIEYGPEPPEDYGRLDSEDDQERRELSEHGEECFG